MVRCAPTRSEQGWEMLCHDHKVLIGGTNTAMPTESVKNGVIRELNGQRRIYYDGYWIKHYDPPADSLGAKKRLIYALTRRLFNHVEHGINIPGRYLEEVRRAHDAELDPQKKRVKTAMLAGALFNRAADIFTKLVELEECGVAIGPDNELMIECGQCLSDALEFGKSVKHRSGDEGIDELWGEPFKAFSMSVEAFYESRYIKMALTMRNVDQIARGMNDAFQGSRVFPGIQDKIQEFAMAAKRKCETLRTDAENFEIWPAFVVAGEQLANFSPQLSAGHSRFELTEAMEGARLLKEGQRIVSYITRARTPMPKTTEEYLNICESHRLSYRPVTTGKRGL